MPRLLITGAGGFVGRYAAATFAAHGYEVIRAGNLREPLDVALDIRDDANVRAVVDLAAPDLVLHLAAQTFVPDSFADPIATYDVNVMGTARLLAALARRDRRARVLFVSSAEVYGRREPQEFPLTEQLAAAPRNPYAASKAAAEILALSARTERLQVVIARSFNHIGPGQDPRFVVAGFAAQLATIFETGRPALSVGNLDAERDFLDVRDVVRAYVALLQDGVDGEIYNVCSGQPVAIREVLRRMITIAGIPVEVRQDPARLRPSDVPRFFGDASKLRRATGWRPHYALSSSLESILQAARPGGNAAP